MTDTPTVTEVRTELVKQAAEYRERRQPFSRIMRSPGTPTDADFWAYEGLITGGCYAEALAAILRVVDERDDCGDLAAELAWLVHDVMENGDDGLDTVNSDVWAVVEATPAPATTIAAERQHPATTPDTPAN